MVTQRMMENAHKVTYLVKIYPEKTLEEVIKLLHMPEIDINAAFWVANEFGWLSEANKKEGTIKLLKTPDTWQFGQAESDLEDTILYGLEQLNKHENDIEETPLNIWVRGYPVYDVLIAFAHLIEDKQIASYVIEDGENAYTFYTLYANREQKWGQKQFKKNPLKNFKRGKRE